MKKFTLKILAAALILTLLLSGLRSILNEGKRLEHIRESVLRLHILADSDSEEDQQLKLKVRDALLKSGIFDDAESLEDAEEKAKEKLADIIELAEKTLRSSGCNKPVTAQLTDMYFDQRSYGSITMPAGNYRALRIVIGSGQGHNWWCVMYPPLCVPAASDKDAEEYFTSEEMDILNKPEKYRVKFALWEELKKLTKRQG